MGPGRRNGAGVNEDRDARHCPIPLAVMTPLEAKARAAAALIELRAANAQVSLAMRESDPTLYAVAKRAALDARARYGEVVA